MQVRQMKFFWFLELGVAWQAPLTFGFYGRAKTRGRVDTYVIEYNPTLHAMLSEETCRESIWLLKGPFPKD